MADVPATTPTDVATEAPSSWDDKLSAKLGITPESDALAAPETLPEGELAADDIQTEEAPEPEGEWLELDRKGERRKVSKEEAKRLAQQGWDYNTNQEQLKAERAIFAQEKAAVQAKAQLTPMVIEAAGNVKAYESALRQYDGFDWVGHAQNDPLGYQATKARYDQLKEGYQQAGYQFGQAMQAAQQVEQTITQAELQQQMGRVMEEAPELRDPVRYKGESERIAKYLKGRGVPDAEIQGLSRADYYLIARDAMRYREAVNAKAERQKNGTPSLRPGPVQVRQSAQVREQEIVTKLHRSKDPAQKKALLDAALAAKLDRMA